MIVLVSHDTSLPITVTVWSVYGSFSSFSPSQSWNFFMSYGVKCNSYDDLTTSIEADGSNTIASTNSLSGKRTMSVYSVLPSNSVFLFLSIVLCCQAPAITCIRHGVSVGRDVDTTYMPGGRVTPPTFDGDQPASSAGGTLCLTNRPPHNTNHGKLPTR